MRGGQAFRASARRAFDLPPRWAEGRARAALGPFPYAEHRTLAEVEGLPEPVVFTPERMGRDDAVLPPASQGAVVAEPVPEPGPVCDPAPASQSEQAGPRIKSGVTEYQAKARDEAAGTGPACESPVVERVSRPAAGRSAAATSEPMDVTAGETATDIPEPSPLPAPRQRVKRPAVELDTPPASPPATPVRERPRWAMPERAVEVRKAPKPIDWGRVAQAAKRQEHAAPAPKRPVRVAMDPGPCPRCGVRGSVGCDHQLPYDEAAL